jgi:hypothetical protein
VSAAHAVFDLRNASPFPATLIPGLDKDGVDNLSVLVKATYKLVPGKAPEIAPEQVPPVMADVHHGDDPATSSVKYQSDACPTKPGTDVVVVGKAYARAGRVPQLDASLEVGPIRKTVRVFGDRAWARAMGWVQSKPLPFEEMPLLYERAFGGWDRSNPDPARHGGDDRNPVGMGFAAANRRERLEGLRLPNLEDARQLIADWNTRPPVAGFGFIGAGWLPRRTLAGTYDASWEEKRAPLLPDDFAPRFFNGAPADQVVAPHLRGGEPVRLRGVSRAGDLAFTLPKLAFEIVLSIRRDIVTTAPVLDTVLIEPDDARLVLSYRVTVPCPRKLAHVEAISVKQR